MIPMLILVILTPPIAQLLWRRLFPASVVPISRYAPHFIFLWLVGGALSNSWSKPSTAALLEHYLVALTIWIACLVALTRFGVHRADTKGAGR